MKEVPISASEIASFYKTRQYKTGSSIRFEKEILGQKIFLREEDILVIEELQKRAGYLTTSADIGAAVGLTRASVMNTFERMRKIFGQNVFNAHRQLGIGFFPPTDQTTPPESSPQ